MEKFVCDDFYNKLFTEKDLETLLSCPIDDESMQGDSVSMDTTDFEEILSKATEDKLAEIKEVEECYNNLTEKASAMQDLVNELADKSYLRDKLIEYYDNIEPLLIYFLHRKFTFTVMTYVITLSENHDTLIQYLKDFDEQLTTIIGDNPNFKSLINLLEFGQTILSSVETESITQTELLELISFDISGGNVSTILSDNIELFKGKIYNYHGQLKSSYKDYTTNVDINKKDITNELTGNLKEVLFFHSKVDYYKLIEIKDNIFLNDKTFFEEIESDSYKLEDKDITKKTEGALYEKYYNQLDDFLNNFFTEEERGVTKEKNNIDSEYTNYTVEGMDISREEIASVKMSSSDEQYYIADKEQYQKFFTTLTTDIEEQLIKKKNEKIGEERTKILSVFKGLGINEAGYFSSKYYSSGNANDGFINIYDKKIEYFLNLLSEIGRLSAEIAAIKDEVDLDNIKNALKNEVSCLSNMDEFDDVEPPDDNGTDWKQFPTFNPDTMEMENLLDPSKPNFEKHCYWLKFAMMATIYGLLPFPDLRPKNPIGFGLRYWPVGLKIPTPAKIINIPLPIIWIPLVTITIPGLGLFVFFLGQCGIFPSPFLLFVNSIGIKKFVVTLRGPSNAIGYDPSGNEPKFRFNIPFSLWYLNLKVTNPFEASMLEDIMKGTSFTDFVQSGISRMTDAINQLGVPELPSLEEKKAKLNIDVPVSTKDIPADEYQQKIEEYQIYASEYMDALLNDVADYIMKINFPVLTILKDKGKSPNEQTTQQLIGMVKEYMDYDLKLPPLKTIDLKQMVFDALTYVKFDPKLEGFAFPEVIDLENPTHFNLVLDYIKIYLEVALLWIGNNLRFLDMISMPPFTISNPLECEVVFELPAFQVIIIGIVQNFIKIVWAAVDLIDTVSITNYLGVTQISAKYLSDMVYKVVDNVVPSFPIPTGEYIASLKTALGPTVLASLFNIIPEIPFNFPTRMPQIEIDTNIIKTTLAEIVRKGLPIQDMLPFQIPKITDYIGNVEEYESMFNAYRIAMLGFFNLNPIDLKVLVIDIIQNQIGGLLNQFKPIFDGANAAMSLYNFKQSILDMLFLPKEMILMAAKTLSQRGIESAIEIPNHLLMKVAFELMKYIEMIPYPVIGAVAMLGFTDIIRVFHPIMPQDDLPPWERLTLNNLLFVLFLDDFCHNGKMYGGFQENFLP